MAWVLSMQNFILSERISFINIEIIKILPLWLHVILPNYAVYLTLVQSVKFKSREFVAGTNINLTTSLLRPLQVHVNLNKIFATLSK